MTHLYLSQLHLNPRNRAIRRDLANPYELHRTIQRAFDGRRETAAALYRLEESLHGDLVLLVQSAEPPNWAALPDETWLQPGGVAVKHFTLALRPGQILRFRLRANPTVKKKREGRHSNRVPLVRPEHQEQWLRRQAGHHGFTLLRLDMVDDRLEDGRVPITGNDRNRMKLYSTRFDGLLRVDDPAKVQVAVRQGIGPARAFGCGLLSLAPAG